ELEGDLERLLAGDQNVGMPPVAGPAPAVRPAPKRWPLVAVGLVVLAGGVTMALRRPAVVAPDAVAPPAAAPPAAVAPPPAAPVAAPARPVAVAPAHKLHVRAERHASKPAAATPANAETSDAVKRGVLPPASRECYPEK